jgi:hypothetical protein
MRVSYQQLTVSAASSGSTPWFSVDAFRNPVNLGLQVTSTGPSWQLDVTMDDPFGANPNPTLNSSLNIAFLSTAFSYTARLVNVFQSSQVGGWGGISSLAGSTTYNYNIPNGNCFAAGVGNAIGGIIQPIAAIRLTQTSAASAGGAIMTLTILQAGPR